jgi:hypothetical protein
VSRSVGESRSFFLMGVNARDKLVEAKAANWRSNLLVSRGIVSRHPGAVF